MHFLRKLTPLVLCAIFFFGFFSVAHADITSNLQGWWRLDEGSGASATDSSGNGDTGTLQAGPAYVTGKIGPYAVSFTSGASQYMSTAQTFNYGSVTVSAWVKMSSAPASRGCVLGFMNGLASGTFDKDLEINIDGTPVWYVYDGSAKVVTGGVSVADGNWHLLTGTADGVNSVLYVDGTQAGTIASGATFAGYTVGNAYINGSTGGSGNNCTYMTETVDDARVYNRALSGSDISQLYTYATNLTSYPGQWYASSGSFFLHALAIPVAGGNPLYSFSTSTTFKVAGAAGEMAVGTSSSASFQVQSGFQRNLYKGPAPAYTQIHYHWRNDDGSETTATSMTSGAQDTAISSVPKLSPVRLRMEISNEGGTVLGYSTQQFRLEYGLLSSTCGAISSWTDVGAAAGDWDMVSSSNLTEGANTSNISTSVGGVTDENHTFIASNAGVRETSSQVDALSVPSDSFAELEYSIEPLAAATDGGVYCFRITNAGSATNFNYTQYPQATLSNGASLTFVTDGSAEVFPSVTPGTLFATSSILSVKTTNSSGFNISIQRSDVTGTMSLGSTYIPDKTDWFAPGATTTAGNATASTTQPLTLQFRVRKAGTDTANYASSWWGIDDTTPNALFGGVSSTTQVIINRSTAAAATTTAFVTFDLNVPVTQKTGTYSGSITYTVTANP